MEGTIKMPIETSFNFTGRNMKRAASCAFALLPIIYAMEAQSSSGVLGTPADGSTVSGVGVISGYHCSSKNIEVLIDGESMGKAGAGTKLAGTLGVCGRTDTGFSLLYNFNNLQPGQHTVSVYADDMPLASHTITTVRSGGVSWLSGVEKTVTVDDFPQTGKSATIEWVQSNQNFMVTSISDTSQYSHPDANCRLTKNLVGTWSFYYTIISTFNDKIFINKATPTGLTGPGEVACVATGWDEFGNETVYGTYNVTTNDGSYTIFDEGSLLTDFYHFKISSNYSVSGSYFFEYNSSGDLSNVYTLYGSRVSDSTPQRSLLKVHADDSQDQIGEDSAISEVLKQTGIVKPPVPAAAAVRNQLSGR